MALSKEGRVDLVLLSGGEGWSCEKIADKFNALHPRKVPICFSTVAKMIWKVMETVSIMDKPR